MIVPYIPKDLLHIILEYDGRIKYRNGKYVNTINQNDERYNVIKPIINKKLIILKTADIRNSDFYFEFEFDKLKYRGLCYDLGFLYRDKFEICYYDFRKGTKQIRTHL